MYCLPASCPPRPGIGGGIIGGARETAGLVGRGVGLGTDDTPFSLVVLAVGKVVALPVFAME